MEMLVNPLPAGSQSNLCLVRPKDGKSLRKHSLFNSPPVPPPPSGNGKIPPPLPAFASSSSPSPAPAALRPKTHQRSKSDMAGIVRSRSGRGGDWSWTQSQNRMGSLSLPRNCLGDLTSGHGFDNGCMCFEPSFSFTTTTTTRGGGSPSSACACGATRLLPQLEFVKSLIQIGKNLSAIATKDDKTPKLIAELNLVNLNLPARVWLPVHNHISHLVLRIPPQDATVLNSKDKVSTRHTSRVGLNPLGFFLKKNIALNP